MALSRTTAISAIRFTATFGLLGYAVFFMQGTMQDWSENPVQTIIETLNYPVQNLQFPSITVCHGEKNRPLYFGFVEVFFNYIRLKCDLMIEGDCNAIKPARKAFSFLLDPLAILFKNEIDKSLKNNYYENAKSSSALYKIKMNFISTMLSGNKSTAEAMVTDLERLYSNGTAMGQADLDRFANSWALKNRLYSYSESSNMKAQCNNDTTYKTGCQALLTRLQTAGKFLDIAMEPTGIMLKRFFYVVDKVEIENYETGEGLMVSVLRNIINGGNLNRTITDATISISLMDLPLILRSENPDGYSISAPDFIGQFNYFNEYQSKWTEFMEQETLSHPCENKIFVVLCTFLTSQLQDRMLEVHKIMRFSKPQWNNKQSSADLLTALFNNSLNFLGDFDFFINDTMKYQFPLSVPRCGFSDKNKANGNQCNLFSPTWTDSGICGTFNAASFRESFNMKVADNEIFSQVYTMKEDNKTIFNISGSGQAFSFSFLLDAQQLDSSYTNYEPIKASFDVGVGNVLSFFSARSGSAINVRAGEEVTLRVIPTEVHFSESIRSIPIEKRRCRFSDEIDGRVTLFNYYTQAACSFECSLRRATYYCRCVPYNYPNLAKAPLCDYYGAFCFTSAMKFSQSKTDDCTCESDCQAVTFSYSAERKTIDFDDICSDEFSPVFQYILQTRVFSSMRSELSKLSGIDTGSLNEYCKEKILTDLSIINVEIATDFISRSRYQEKSTFADKLSSVGGTIGLFNGMSIITFVDAVILVIVFVIKKRPKANISRNNVGARKTIRV